MHLISAYHLGCPLGGLSKHENLQKLTEIYFIQYREYVINVLCVPGTQFQEYIWRSLYYSRTIIYIGHVQKAQLVYGVRCIRQRGSQWDRALFQFHVGISVGFSV